jgi:phenylacetate-CoA ligase
MSGTLNTYQRSTPIKRSWSWLLKTAVLPIGDFLIGQHMMRRLRFLEEAQWWDLERIHEYRDCSLHALMQVVYAEVPFYRELMNEAGVRASDIRRPDDLYKLPIVTKEMLQSRYPKLTTRPTGQNTYEVHTSGSTGKNFCVKEDADTAGWQRASFLLALEWAGWHIGESHLQTGMSLNRGVAKRLKDMFLQCHYVSAFDLSDSRLEQSLDVLEGHGIQHLWGYPASLYYLACLALKKGWNNSLRSVVTWGDNLHPQHRKTIETAFRTRVFDTYGCGEGMQISAQCGQDDVYHIHALDVVVEFLDAEGNPVEPGQPGNIVLTRLHPGPMPFIRYRVGDVGISGNGRRCSCRRGYDLMESIEGRDTDVVVTPSGNRLIVHFFTGILEHFAEIDCFQVVQETIDTMLVRIVPTTHISSTARERIASALLEKGALGMDIRIELVDSIPLTPGGKRRFVISRIKDSLGGLTESVRKQG